MEFVETRIENGLMSVKVNGKVSSQTASEFEDCVFAPLSDGNVSAVELDCENLEYISSAGLRVLLKLKKTINELTLVNVSSEILKIMELTGFSGFLDVRK